MEFTCCIGVYFINNLTPKIKQMMRLFCLLKVVQNAFSALLKAVRHLVIWHACSAGRGQKKLCEWGSLNELQSYNWVSLNIFRERRDYIWSICQLLCENYRWRLYENDAFVLYQQQVSISYWKKNSVLEFFPNTFRNLGVKGNLI